MFKKVTLFRALLIAYGMIPLTTFAQASDNITPIAKNVLNLSRVLVTVVFVLAIVVFGWGIVKFISSAGSPDKVKEGKHFLLWGVVGMAVGASLFGLVQFMQVYFGIQAGQLTIQPPIIQ